MPSLVRRGAIALLFVSPFAAAAEPSYENAWSAEEMIGTPVRGDAGESIGEVKDIVVDRAGTVSSVIVEVGGLLELGDQHIGVPWKDVRMGPQMQWVQVPLREARAGTYSLYGRVPQGEEVAIGGSAWRVKELIGDYASLRDVPRYGIVTDVIFREDGRAQAVVVHRGPSSLGAPGPYAYPYPHGGFDPRAYDYPLPYSSAEIGRFGRYDYVKLGELSRFANSPKEDARASPRRARP